MFDDFHAVALEIVRAQLNRAPQNGIQLQRLSLRRHLKPVDEVYAVGEYFQDFPVYLERTVSVVGYQGELEFGIHSEPDKTADRFINRETFLQRWQGSNRCFAIAKRSEFDSLLAKGDFPHFNLGEFHGVILFANRAP